MKRVFAIVVCLLSVLACGPAFTVGEQASPLLAVDAGAAVDAPSSSSVLDGGRKFGDVGKAVVDAQADVLEHDAGEVLVDAQADVVEHDAGELLVDAQVDVVEHDAVLEHDAGEVLVDAQADVLEHDAAAPPPDCPNPDHCPRCTDPLDLPCCTAVNVCSCMPRMGGTCL